MLDSIRKFLTLKTGKRQETGWKNWVAYVLFGAIIVVFALFGITPGRMGNGIGGVAAVVNDTSITLAEYRQRVEAIEQNARMRFDQFPEQQRRALTQQMRQSALRDLIQSEIMYQAAESRGVIASDAEVRDYIMQIPVLNEGGKFQRDRYRMLLQNYGLSAEDFERQIRKQIVMQKLEELFVGAATPSREELRRNRVLANQKVNLRYAEIPKVELGKLLTEADVQSYMKDHQADIEKYYNDNKVEFSKPERVKARHILVRVSDKRSDADAQKLAAELRKQATPKNFSELATKNSDDPGSKAKGGDLGEFEAGRMVPEFEKAAFALESGQISDPVKTNFGYHIIYVEKKTPAVTEPLDKVRTDIARKLVARSKEGDVVAHLRKVAESGNKAETEALLNKSGFKFQETGEFDLSSSMIPKLGESPVIMASLLKHGKKGGLIPQLIDNQGSYVVAEVTSWKEEPDKTPEVEGLERMVAFRKSADLRENWVEVAKSKASVEINPRLMQQ